jgi:hypothetical protein
MDEHFRSAMRAAGAELRADEIVYDDELEPERPWRRRVRRWGVNIISAPLYAVQWAWDRRVDVGIVACVTAWVGYWGTAWIFLIIDRMGY